MDRSSAPPTHPPSVHTHPPLSHSSVFYDIVNPHLMELLFGPSAWQQMRRYFRSLHVTNEYGDGSYKQVRCAVTSECAGACTGRRDADARP